MDFWRIAARVAGGGERDLWRIAARVASYFSVLETGSPASFIAYRKEFSAEKAQKFIDMFDAGALKPVGTGKVVGTYITDDPSAWRGGATLEMEVTVDNPLVLVDDPKSLEERLWDKKWFAEVSSEYDAVISVPGRKAGVKAPQGILFHPQDQITSVSIVGDGREKAA